jgi:hypothetical protein
MWELDGLTDKVMDQLVINNGHVETSSDTFHSDSDSRNKSTTWQWLIFLLVFITNKNCMLLYYILKLGSAALVQCVSRMRKRPFKGTSGATFLRHYRALRR